MNRIRLLSELVANQIAAGEVVERPASVVKELVENALDAGASRITVEIQAGGRSLIRVTDDGFGMSKDDALLCLERHATSKIQKAEDLVAIGTLGFRGEALPSIASVSRFTLTSCERGGDSHGAVQVIVHGGKIMDVKSAGHAPGTSVEARQLFYNLPARRKFLRSEETERTHVQHYLTLAALAFPGVGFTFLQDQRVVWQLPPLKSDDRPVSRLAALRERLRALLGGEMKLLPVDVTADIDSGDELDEFREAPPVAGECGSSLRIWGFIGAPGVSRATRQDQHLFVNRRPVENRALNYALLEGYHTALMKGRYPVCCLLLELDPAEVDVNIHPAKREVKFRRERAVRREVAGAVRRTLLAFHTAASAAKGRPEPGAEVPKAGRNPSDKTAPVVPETKDLPHLLSPPAEPISNRLPPLSQATLAAPAATVNPSPSTVSSSTVRGLQSNFSSVSTAAVPLLKVPLRLVGVIGRLYVVLESDRGLVLMDQHAAHERIL
ncbi:MAG TPA: DNA mismatch repair endonuclease MutL, partial [Candidatus Angelobacter sp.]|nr:DNA mismatch repair endonuclease MutL [Candidatus Angelobacter sp.]